MSRGNLDVYEKADEGVDPKVGGHPANAFVENGLIFRDDQQEWLWALGDYVTLDIERSGVHCGELSVEDLSCSSDCIEQALIDNFGGGDYTVRPRGGPYRFKILTFRIGSPLQRADGDARAAERAAARAATEAAASRDPFRELIALKELMDGLAADNRARHYHELVLQLLRTQPRR